MIKYFGGPITPASAAVAAWKGNHAMVSFAHPDCIDLAMEITASTVIDNGAYSIWKAGRGRVDVDAYEDFVSIYLYNPRFAWCLIADVIDGTEKENDALIDDWLKRARIPKRKSVPVWHMNESLERLRRLCQQFDRIAIGSSGEYAVVGTLKWWDRMDDAMEIICDDQGRPLVDVHGLRMLDPKIYAHIPLQSGDSTGLAINSGYKNRWETGPYPPPTTAARAAVLAEISKITNSASHWVRRARQRVGLFDDEVTTI